ncbi:phosphopantetheine-binding protein [Kitasatospora sp. NBC_01287]|uniref:phosphopantetheine-binding protein n=1 Tax=Kitasatospora sp. NBC_01287 TaxID=2903573 RepID=UPI00225BCCF7|nr:phosphopantetheine-binding protein [Kitasatospora sp. NBC_01287]MCX4751628.1 phosphopantetheine-binding protein [Kitasatospora sp. NBC_01287]
MSTAITRAEFAALVRDGIGIEVAEGGLDRDFDLLPGWDSVQLLSLLVLLERRVDRPLSLPDLLDARSLESIYELVTR